MLTQEEFVQTIYDAGAPNIEARTQGSAEEALEGYRSYIEQKYVKTYDKMSAKVDELVNETIGKICEVEAANIQKMDFSSLAVPAPVVDHGAAPAREPEPSSLVKDDVPVPVSETETANDEIAQAVPVPGSIVSEAVLVLDPASNPEPVFEPDAVSEPASEPVPAPTADEAGFDESGAVYDEIVDMPEPDGDDDDEDVFDGFQDEDLFPEPAQDASSAFDGAFGTAQPQSSAQPAASNPFAFTINASAPRLEVILPGMAAPSHALTAASDDVFGAFPQQEEASEPLSLDDLEEMPNDPADVDQVVPEINDERPFDGSVYEELDFELPDDGLDDMLSSVVEAQPSQPTRPAQASGGVFDAFDLDEDLIDDDDVTGEEMAAANNSSIPDKAVYGIDSEPIEQPVSSDSAMKRLREMSDRAFEDVCAVIDGSAAPRDDELGHIQAMTELAEVAQAVDTENTNAAATLVEEARLDLDYVFGDTSAMSVRAQLYQL